MDHKVNEVVLRKATRKQEGAVMFEIIKRIIRNENIKLMERIAREYKMDVDYLIETYIKPEYYLPIVDKT